MELPAVLWLGQEFDSVKIKRTVTDRPAKRYSLSAGWMEEFDLDSRSQGQVRHGKKAHPNVAEIDAESVYVNGSCKHSSEVFSHLRCRRRRFSYFALRPKNNCDTHFIKVTQAFATPNVTKVQCRHAAEW